MSGCPSMLGELRKLYFDKIDVANAFFNELLQLHAVCKLARSKLRGAVLALVTYPSTDVGNWKSLALL